jgi:hypothetical protein
MCKCLKRTVFDTRKLGKKILLSERSEEADAFLRIIRDDVNVTIASRRNVEDGLSRDLTSAHFTEEDFAGRE